MRLPAKLIEAIASNDQVTINSIRNTIFTSYGPRTWYKLYEACESVVNTDSYKFTDFSSKVSKNNSDKAIVGNIEPGHNED